jgi:gliding motility-associated-like protein
MKIYNRWGEKLFETDILNDGWDGTANGEPCTEGTYVCLIELMGNDNFRKVLYREFHLLR